MSKNLTRREAIRPDRERCCPAERGAARRTTGAGAGRHRLPASGHRRRRRAPGPPTPN